jgi:16S rRNA (guanine966-N2)-methyltransferase
MFSMLEAEALRRGFTADADPETGELRFAAGQAWPRVLDLFAGSGALGIEALSRGSRWADFVERDRDACESIRANLHVTGLSQSGRVICASVEATLGALSEAYDLVLLDPPYRDAAAALTALRQLHARQLLSPNGIVVWEHERSPAPEPHPEGLHVLRHRDHGSTSVTLLERDPGPEHVAYEPSQ